MLKPMLVVAGIAGVGTAGFHGGAAWADPEPSIASPSECVRAEEDFEIGPVSAPPGGVAGRPSVHFAVGEESPLMRFVRRFTGGGTAEASLYDTVARVEPPAVGAGPTDLDPPVASVRPGLEATPPSIDVGEVANVGRMDPSDLDPNVGVGLHFEGEPAVVPELAIEVAGPQVEMDPGVLQLDPVIPVDPPIDSTTSLEVPVGIVPGAGGDDGRK